MPAIAAAAIAVGYGIYRSSQGSGVNEGLINTYRELNWQAIQEQQRRDAERWEFEKGLAEEQLGIARENLEIQRSLAEAQITAAREQLGMSKQAWDRYVNTFIPVEDKYIGEALRPLGEQPDYLSNMAGIRRNFGNIRGQTAADLARRLPYGGGLKTGTMTGLNLLESRELNKAATSGNLSRLDKMSNAVNMGRGLPTFALGGYAGALGAYSGASGATSRAGVNANYPASGNAAQYPTGDLDALARMRMGMNASVYDSLGKTFGSLAEQYLWNQNQPGGGLKSWWYSMGGGPNYGMAEGVPIDSYPEFNNDYAFDTYSSYGF